MVDAVAVTTHKLYSIFFIFLNVDDFWLFHGSSFIKKKSEATPSLIASCFVVLAPRCTESDLTSKT